MKKFHIIDDAAIILRSKGVYRQAKVYRRGDELFAGYGTGFIILYEKGGTSLPRISWIDIDAGDTEVGSMGRLCIAPVRARKAA